MKIRTDILERKDEILQWILEKQSNSEIAKRLNCKVDTLKSYYKKMNIDYKGNQGGKGIKSDPKRKTAEELSLNSSISSSRLRNRILDDNIKERKCEKCGLEQWLCEPIPLELHHIDGNHYNNDLNNLQILCPNCHSMTNTHSRCK